MNAHPINILIPKSFGKVDGEEALRKILAEQTSPSKPKIAQGTSPTLILGDTIQFDFFTVNKKRTWNETHLDLQENGWRMPTPYEFLAFIYHLNQKDSDLHKKVLKHIFDGRNSFWLDAEFALVGDKPFMFTNHIVRKVAGPTTFNLDPQKSYPLEARYGLMNYARRSVNLCVADAIGFPSNAQPGSGGKYFQAEFEEPMHGRVAAFSGRGPFKSNSPYYSFSAERNIARKVYACRDVKP